MAVILFLGAKPSDTTRLALDTEVREISQRLARSAHRDDLRLVQEWAVSAGDLQEHLLRHRAAVVHSGGHGNPDGHLLVDDGQGRAFALDRAALSDLFRILKADIRCVVLSACFSDEQAAAIAEHIDCVVGSKATVLDASALEFAGAFYQALAFGESVQRAFELGKKQMNLRAGGQPAAPVLLVRAGVNAAEVVIVPPAPRPRSPAVGRPTHVGGRPTHVGAMAGARPTLGAIGSHGGVGVARPTLKRRRRGAPDPR